MSGYFYQHVLISGKDFDRRTQSILYQCFIYRAPVFLIKILTIFSKYLFYFCLSAQASIFFSATSRGIQPSFKNSS